MAEMVRVNTKISKKMSDWLEYQVEETGLTKSAIIFLALEQYMLQREAVSKVPEYLQLIERMEKLQDKVK